MHNYHSDMHTYHVDMHNYHIGMHNYHIDTLPLLSTDYQPYRQGINHIDTYQSYREVPYEHARVLPTGSLKRRPPILETL